MNDNELKKFKPTKPASDTFAFLWVGCEILFFIGGIIAGIWVSPWWLLFSLLAFALLMGGV